MVRRKRGDLLAPRLIRGRVGAVYRARPGHRRGLTPWFNPVTSCSIFLGCRLGESPGRQSFGMTICPAMDKCQYARQGAQPEPLRDIGGRGAVPVKIKPHGWVKARPRDDVKLSPLDE